MNTLTEKERQEVIEFATDATSTKCLIISNSLNESIQSYNDGKRIGIQLGAEFLAELRAEENPSEDIVLEIRKILVANSSSNNCIYEHRYRPMSMEIANLPQIRANCNVNEELLELLDDVGESLELQLNRLGCQTESAPLKSDTDSLGGLSVLARLREYIQNAKNKNQ